MARSQRRRPVAQRGRDPSSEAGVAQRDGVVALIADAEDERILAAAEDREVADEPAPEPERVVRQVPRGSTTLSNVLGRYQSPTWVCIEVT